jgi:hypothetical protein
VTADPTPSAPAPGSDLADAEQWCRLEVYGITRNHVLKTLMAEYDRRGAELERLRALDVLHLLATPEEAARAELAGLREAATALVEHWTLAPHAQDRREDSEETKRCGELLDRLAAVARGGRG